MGTRRLSARNCGFFVFREYTNRTPAVVPGWKSQRKRDRTLFVSLLSTAVLAVSLSLCLWDARVSLCPFPVSVAASLFLYVTLCLPLSLPSGTETGRERKRQRGTDRDTGRQAERKKRPTGRYWMLKRDRQKRERQMEWQQPTEIGRESVRRERATRQRVTAQSLLQSTARHHRQSQSCKRQKETERDRQRVRKRDRRT